MQLISAKNNLQHIFLMKVIMNGRNQKKPTEKINKKIANTQKPHFSRAKNLTTLFILIIPSANIFFHPLIPGKNKFSLKPLDLTLLQFDFF